MHLFELLKEGKRGYLILSLGLVIMWGCVACASAPDARRATQNNELRYRELLKILPDDADRTRLVEQDKAVKQGKYYTKEGQLIPLIKPDEATTPSKLSCRTCQSEATVTNDSANKPERKQPYVIKVE